MLLAVVLVAVLFDFINGFHDTANAIATSVATRALRPHYALLMAAFFNFFGAFAGTAVAKTIGAGLVDEQTTTQVVVAAALIGAIIWNLITWRLGLPSSSSHALIGGLLGATAIAVGTGAFKWDGIINKVLVPLVTSPIVGFIGAFVLMVALLWIFHNQSRKPMTNLFRRLQVFSAGYMAFAHGSNDAQKTMGIITLALFSAGVISTTDVPLWVIVVSASAISLGTATGGWRIMRTMGQKVVKLEPIHGFARGDHRRQRPARDRAHGHARVHHAGHLERDHGRRLEQGPSRRPLGRRPQHPHRMGPDDPGGGRDRRPRLGHHERVGPQMSRDAATRTSTRPNTPGGSAWSA